jgi:lipid A 3-O-deacylase
MKCFRSALNLFIISCVFLISTNAYAGSLVPRFEKGHYQFGAELGYGAGVNLPSGPDRTDIQFFHIAANFQYDLTGNIGKSWYQGNLYWFTELGADFLHNPEFGSLVGISPLMVQYKFIKPNKKWAPTVLAGAGVSLTDWDEKDLAEREIGGDFQFLLHLGTGLEFFRPNGGSFSVNYRFFHISNAGTQRPNIGLNANLFTLGFTF